MEDILLEEHSRTEKRDPTASHVFHIVFLTPHQSIPFGHCHDSASP